MPTETDTQNPEGLRQTLKRRLRELQARVDLSGEQMARIAGKSQSSWSAWTDPRKSATPSALSLALLCRHFGLSMDWLMRGDLESAIWMVDRRGILARECSKSREDPIWQEPFVYAISEAHRPERSSAAVHALQAEMQRLRDSLP